MEKIEHVLICPHCEGEIQTSTIPDAIIIHEKAVRNGRKARGVKKSVPSHRKGSLLVWRDHRESRRRCYCPACHIERLLKSEEAQRKSHELGSLSEGAYKQLQSRRAKLTRILAAMGIEVPEFQPIPNLRFYFGSDPIKPRSMYKRAHRVSNIGW